MSGRGRPDPSPRATIIPPPTKASWHPSNMATTTPHCLCTHCNSCLRHTPVNRTERKLGVAVFLVLGIELRYTTRHFRSELAVTGSQRAADTLPMVGYSGLRSCFQRSQHLHSLLNHQVSPALSRRHSVKHPFIFCLRPYLRLMKIRLALNDARGERALQTPGYVQASCAGHENPLCQDLSMVPGEESELRLTYSSH